MVKQYKKRYTLNDEFLVEVKSVFKVNLTELGLQPNQTSLSKIKKHIAKAYASLIEGSPSDELSPVLYDVNLLLDTLESKSRPSHTDEEDSNSN